MEKPSKERIKKTLSIITLLFSSLAAVAIVGLTIIQTSSKNDKTLPTTDEARKPVFHANIGCITKEIGSTKTESRVLYFTPGSDKAIMRYRSEGKWLDSLENTIELSYAFSGDSELKIWLISDIHILYTETSNDNFITAIADIDGAETPDYVFVLGDIGSLDQYLAAKNASNLPPEKWYELAGNHEIKSRRPLNADYFKNKLGYQDLSYTLTIDNVFFIFLGDEGFVETELTPKQRTWLAEQLASNSDKNIVVLCHYAIFDTTGNTKDEQTTAFATPVADIQSILDTYQIDMWLHGHIHIDATASSTVYK